MNFIISKAVRTDIPEIEAVFSGARQFMADNGNAGQWGKHYPSIDDIEADLKEDILYVCRPEADSRIAAVFAYFKGVDENYDVIEGSGWINELPYGVIHRVAVAEFARGMGAPSACIEYCFRDCGNLRIDTHEKNTPMRRLIEKNGFTYCGDVAMKKDGTMRMAFQKAAKLVLASKSPRRIELIQKLGVPFLVDPATGDELVPDSVDVSHTAVYLAGLKAAEIKNKYIGQDCTVIGSDTVVICEGEIFGKPVDEADAFRMLRKLSGRTHEVHTGVSIISKDKRIEFTSAARVSFYDMSDSEIKAYISSGEPMDKAGAYGIQGQGALFIRKIDGDFYTVMGLPIAELYHRLSEEKVEIC